MADSPLVLSVGQCSYDHGSISRALRQDFNATVEGADTHAQALKALRAGTAGKYALVLVNRVTDVDGSLGLDLIQTIKADPTLAHLPLMLVSNYTDAQATAQTAGALPGFGKSDIGSNRFHDTLKPILAPQHTH